MNAHTLRANMIITCHVGSREKPSQLDYFFSTTTNPIHHRGEALGNDFIEIVRQCAPTYDDFVEGIGLFN